MMNHMQIIQALLVAIGKRYPAAPYPRIVVSYDDRAIDYSLRGGAIAGQRVPFPPEVELYPYPRLDFRHVGVEWPLRIPYKVQSAPLAGDGGTVTVWPNGRVEFKMDWVS
jgi:hypothetical protein